MKAVVLVGGEGTRLRPLTLGTPKQMLPIGGRPMIEHVIGHLAGHGIDEVILSLGFLPDAFLAAYPSGRCGQVALRYAVEDQPLDTAGAIAFAASVAAVDETFVVVNGDVLTDLDVSALIAFHRSRGGRATIALTPVEDPSAFGVVPTDAHGLVEAFIEKPAREEAPTNFINAGTYVLEPEVLSRIPGGRRVSIERETFPALVAAGELYAMRSDAPWLDAGTPATYLAANLQYAGPPGPDTDVDASAHVTGSLLGAGVRVGAGAVVSGSLLLDGARVSEGAIVQDSILGVCSLVGAQAKVTDLTVIGHRVDVEPGAAHANERLPAPSP